MSDFMFLLEQIKKRNYNNETLELVSLKNDSAIIYETLSSFSNQNEGGTIVFGIDKANNFELVGVNDHEKLLKSINEECLQMEPVLTPLIGVFHYEDKTFVTCEIPPIEFSKRPCYYKGKGKLGGSYIRVEDKNCVMREFELYTIDSTKKKIEEDLRVVPNVLFSRLNQEKIGEYLIKAKLEHPHLKLISDDLIFELMGFKKDNLATLTGIMLFADYPQGYFPNLAIMATRVNGTEIGNYPEGEARFIDKQRIEGTLVDMLNSALAFARRNINNEYPALAIREAILNALIHRDYSEFTQTMPIQLLIFDDRLEVRNPGGVYGGLSVSSLGKSQPLTRNTSIVRALETLKITENRYSGIPTIKNLMENANLKETVFISKREEFKVIFYNKKKPDFNYLLKDSSDILEFCKTPRTKEEIANYLGFKTVGYSIKLYVQPLIDRGLIKLLIPDKPSSKNQRYMTKIK